MSTITLTEAETRFRQVLDGAQHEPVHVQENGRDVAVVVSAAEYERLAARENRFEVRSRVKELLAESIEKRSEVYKALAKISP